jgi:hypothetical protein
MGSLEATGPKKDLSFPKTTRKYSAGTRRIKKKNIYLYDILLTVYHCVSQ